MGENGLFVGKSCLLAKEKGCLVYKEGLFMDLKFLGRGSAFNVDEGNTNAFYKNDKGQMLLIDCGELTFSKIKNLNLLSDVKELFVAITHTNSDHFGSLSSLILYSYFVLKTKVNILLTGNRGQDRILKYLIKNMGIQNRFINYVKAKEFVGQMTEFKSFSFIKSPHDLILNIFGIVYETNAGITYYSSDTSCSKLLKKYLEIDNLNRIYIDVSYPDFDGNVHLSFKKLKEAVSSEKRNKVYAMHIDNNKLIDLLKEEGFNVVEVFKN